MKLKWQKYVVFVIILAVGLVCDLLLKHILDGANYNIIPNFFTIKSSHNYGAAWSSFSGKVFLLTTLSFVFIAVFFVVDRFLKNKNLLYYFGFSFIVTGALGNLIDRIFLGYVRDYFHIHWFSFIFNFADVCLTIGVILYVIFLLFFESRSKSKSKVGDQK